LPNRLSDKSAKAENKLKSVTVVSLVLLLLLLLTAAAAAAAEEAEVSDQAVCI
jgi:hypothetical protein